MSKRTQQLLKENNCLDKQLCPADQQAMTDMVVYIRSAKISAYDQELVRRDITRMILDGASRGESAAEVIGGDYRVFCDSIIAEIPPLSRGERLLALVRDGLLAFAALLGIWLIFNLIGLARDAGGWPLLTVTLGDVLGFAVILLAAFAIFTLVSKNAFTSHRADVRLFAAVFIVLLAAICASAFVKAALFTVSVYVVISLLLALLAAYKIIDRRVD